MAKIKSPLRFSRHFQVDPAALEALGTFDPALEADTPLFIDPVLLQHSSAPEIATVGSERMGEFFSDLYSLVHASQRVGDRAWKAALARLVFHEVPGTCIGYGGGSIRGSGWGSRLTTQLLVDANEIIKAGVDDPRLFLLIGLFSDGIGPDRISDMTSNITLEALAAYTERICDSIGVGVEPFELQGREYFLPPNPTQHRSTPIILLPRDILRDLPVAFSVDEIWRAAAHNERLREAMNEQIGALWQKANREQKHEVLRGMLQDPEYARELIGRMANIRAQPYDQAEDKRGLLVWTELAYSIAGEEPKEINRAQALTREELDRIVVEIIEQFQFLMEKRDLWRVLDASDSRKTEKTAQLLFYAVAFGYCMANGLDITPEADTGTGTVDFKFADGAHPKILVELKLSSNNIQHGHDVQLPAYVVAEQADGSHYIVIDIGYLRRKWSKLIASRTEKGQVEPRVWLIDALPKVSASKRK